MTISDSQHQPTGPEMGPHPDTVGLAGGAPPAEHGSNVLPPPPPPPVPEQSPGQQFAFRPDTTPSPQTPPRPMEAFSYTHQPEAPKGNRNRVLAVVGGTAAGLALLAGGVLLGRAGNDGDAREQVSTETPPNDDAQIGQPGETVEVDEPDPITDSPELAEAPSLAPLDESVIGYPVIADRLGGATAQAPNGESFFIPGIQTTDSPETAINTFLNGLSAYMVTGDQFALGALVDQTSDPNIQTNMDVMFDRFMVEPVIDQSNPSEATRQVIWGTQGSPPTFGVEYGNIMPENPQDRRTIYMEGDGGHDIYIRSVYGSPEGDSWQDVSRDPEDVQTSWRIETLSITLAPAGGTNEVVASWYMAATNEVTGEEVFFTDSSL